jgi:hypothetical protein
MTDQARAAALDGRQVVWHIQERRFTTALQELAKRVDKPNLTIICDPGPQ